MTYKRLVFNERLTKDEMINEKQTSDKPSDCIVLGCSKDPTPKPFLWLVSWLFSDEATSF